MGKPTGLRVLGSVPFGRAPDAERLVIGLGTRLRNLYFQP